jgi:SAM-dependent methyltransferase
VSAPRYPIPTTPSLADRAVRRAKRIPIFCPTCGQLSAAVAFDDNLRESGRCRRCGATNRQRQMALVACRAMAERTGRKVRDLPALADLPGVDVYNTEAQGPLHERLRRAPGYRCSEYLGPDHAPGEQVGEVCHEDLMGLSFADASFDLVLSSDVFEHVPDPYKGHAEVHRVLKPGGHHVFTVPFHQHAHLDDVRARMDADGGIEFLAEPIHHLDPVRPEGVLVFTIFGLEMLVRLAELGLDTRFYALREPWYGIVGPNALVFDAVKAA